MSTAQAAAGQPIIYTRPVVYCVVPADLASRLHTMLDEWFAQDPGVEVIVERRSGVGRRAADAGAPDGVERRVAERRAVTPSSTAAAEDWPLPWGARRHAERLSLVLYDVPVHGRDSIRLERMLIDRVRGGDGAAADELYARYFGRVHGWAVHAVGRRRAEDATQEIFGTAFERFSDPELDSRRFDRWLSSIAAEVTER
jgi:hypothetical protein